MSTTLYFTDGARTAALHILDSDFGRRLDEIDTVTIHDDGTCLSLRFLPDLAVRISRGESILMSALASFVTSAAVIPKRNSEYPRPFSLKDLAGVDDTYWDRVVAAIIFARGRVIEQVAS